MKALLDSSVLVAAVREADLRCEVSRKLINSFKPGEACCAAHSLAEVYASLTGMRPPNRFKPGQAMLVLETIRGRMKCISLTPEEVIDTAHRLAGINLTGGVIYDALLLECARKADAELIYTWNLKHFRMVAPDLASRIVSP
jgi:predicted nucleic acid-binding protein